MIKFTNNQPLNLNRHEPLLEHTYYSEEVLVKKPSELLAKHGFLPDEPCPVDIENFVEYIAGFQYSSDMPDSIDGATQFSLDGSPLVYIADRLAEPDASVTYLRSTIAHECGHVLFHNPCFIAAYNKLSDEQKNAYAQGTLAFRNTADYRWYEWQANKAAASFLMPYKHVITVFYEALGAIGDLKGCSEYVVWAFLMMRFPSLLQSIFEVSKRMAEITAKQFHSRNRLAIRTMLASRGVVLSAA